MSRDATSVLCSNNGIDISLVRQLIAPHAASAHSHHVPSTHRRLTDVAVMLGKLRMVCMRLHQHFRSENFERDYPELAAVRKRRAFLLYSGKSIYRPRRYKSVKRTARLDRDQSDKPWRKFKQPTRGDDVGPLSDAAFEAQVSGPRGQHDQRLKNFLTFGSYWEHVEDSLIAGLPYEFVVSVSEQLGEAEAEFIQRWLDQQGLDDSQRRLMLHKLSPHLRGTNWWFCDYPSEAHRQLDAEMSAVVTTVYLKPFEPESSKLTCQFGVAREGVELQHRLCVCNPTHRPINVSLDTSETFERHGFEVIPMKELTIDPLSHETLTIRVVAMNHASESKYQESLYMSFKSHEGLRTKFAVKMHLEVVGSKHSFWLQDLLAD